MQRLLLTFNTGEDDLRSDSEVNLAVKIRGIAEPEVFEDVANGQEFPPNSVRCFPITVRQINNISEIEHFQLTHVTNGGVSVDNWDGSVVVDQLGDRPIASEGPHRFNGRDRAITFRPDEFDNVWSDVGHANNVVAMTFASDPRFSGFPDQRVDTPEEQTLFAATRSRILAWRRPSAADENWQAFDDPADIVAMASLGEMMFSVSSGGFLGQRQGSRRESQWTTIDGPGNDVRAMAAAGGRLWSISSGGWLSWRDNFTPTGTWARVNSGNDIVAMTGGGNTLLGVSSAGRLMSRPASIAPNVAWTDIGDAEGVVAIAVDMPRDFVEVDFLYAATRDNRLIRRPVVI